jgi:hypothetical protein
VPFTFHYKVTPQTDTSHSNTAPPSAFFYPEDGDRQLLETFTHSHHNVQHHIAADSTILQTVTSITNITWSDAHADTHRQTDRQTVRLNAQDQMGLAKLSQTSQSTFNVKCLSDANNLSSTINKTGQQSHYRPEQALRVPAG